MSGRPGSREIALERLRAYDHLVLAYRDARGFPMNISTGFSIAHDGSVLLEDAAPAEIRDGDDVLVTGSHVRPQPGVGYDQRRYLNAWGKLRRRDGLSNVDIYRTAGWDEDEISFFEYCERSVPRAHEYLDRLTRERGEAVKPQLGAGWRLFLATRVPFLTATLVPVLLGAVIARADGFSAWWYLALALIGASAIHLGLNVINDLFDTASGADPANFNPTPFSGGSRVIQYGLVSIRGMRILAGAFFVTGIAIGILLAGLRGWAILGIGAAGVFLAVFYTAPPIKLVYRGLGDAAVAVGFGPIMVVGAYYVVAQNFSWVAFYASLPVAIFVMLILYVNQIPDRQADRAAGKRTVAVRFSKKAIIRGYDVAAAAGFALVPAGVIGGLLPWPVLIVLLAIPLAIKVHRGLVVSYDNPYELMPAMGSNILLHAVTGAGLVGGFAASLFV